MERPLGNDRPDFERLVADILAIRSRNGISWAALGSLIGRDAKQVRRWLAHRQTPRGDKYPVLVQLHHELTADTVATLNRLKIPLHRRDPRLRTHADAGNPLLGANLLSHDVQDYIANSLTLSGRGLHRAGFMLLSAFFRQQFPILPENGMQVLPALIYIGYRYMPRGVFVSELRNVVVRALRQREHKCLGPPSILALIQAQIASALSEGGRGVEASPYFEEKLRAYFRGEREVPWYRPQLIRADAMYRVMHLRQYRDACDGIRIASQLSSSEGNLRSVTTVSATASWARRDFSEAWSAIQPFYDSARAELLRAVGTQTATLDDMLHLMSAIYFGAVSRQLAQAPYRAADAKDDFFLLNTCLTRLETPSIWGGDLGPARERLPVELQEVVMRVQPDPLDDFQAHTLFELLELLDF